MGRGRGKRKRVYNGFWRDETQIPQLADNQFGQNDFQADFGHENHESGYHNTFEEQDQTGEYGNPEGWANEHQELNWQRGGPVEEHYNNSNWGSNDTFGQGNMQRGQMMMRDQIDGENGGLHFTPRNHPVVHNVAMNWETRGQPYEENRRFNLSFNEHSMEDDAWNRGRVANEDGAWNRGRVANEDDAWNRGRVANEDDAWNRGRVATEDDAWNGGNVANEDDAWNEGNVANEDDAWNRRLVANEDDAWNRRLVANGNDAWNGGHVATEDDAWNGGHLATEDDAWNRRLVANGNDAWNGGHVATEDDAWNGGHLATEDDAWNRGRVANEDDAWNRGRVANEDDAWNRGHVANEDNTHMNRVPRNRNQTDNYTSFEPNLEPGSYISDDNRPVNMILDNGNLDRRPANHFNGRNNWGTLPGSHDHEGGGGSNHLTGIQHNNIRMSVYNERVVQTFERTRVEFEAEPFVSSSNMVQQQGRVHRNYTCTSTSQFYPDGLEENFRVTRTSVNENVTNPAHRFKKRKQLHSSKSFQFKTPFKKMSVTEEVSFGSPSNSPYNYHYYNHDDGQAVRMDYPEPYIEETETLNPDTGFWVKRTSEFESEYLQGPLLSNDHFNMDMEEVHTSMYENSGYDQGFYEGRQPVMGRLEYTPKSKKKRKQQPGTSSRLLIEPIRKCHVKANQLLYIYFEQAILGFCSNIEEELIREKFQQLWIEFMFCFFKRFWKIFGFKIESESGEFSVNQGLIDVTSSTSKTVRQRFDEIEVRHPSYQFIWFCKSTKQISEVLQREQYSKKLFNVLTPMLLESVYMEDEVVIGLTDAKPGDILKIKCTAYILQDLRQIPGKCAVQMALNFQDETDPMISCIKRTKRIRFLSLMFEKLGRKYANRQIKRWLWACTDFQKESFNSTLAQLKKRGKTPQKWRRFRRKWRLEGRERTVRDLIYGAAAVQADFGVVKDQWTEDDKGSEPEKSFPALNKHVRFPETDEYNDDSVEVETTSQFIDPALILEDQSDIDKAIKNVIDDLISNVEKIQDLDEESVTTDHVEFLEHVINLEESSENTLIFDESDSNCDEEVYCVQSVQGTKDFETNLEQIIENDEETEMAGIILDNIIESVVQLGELDSLNSRNISLSC